MTTWMKYVLGIFVPLMFYMVLRDTVDDFYGDRSSELSYVVVEPEDLAAEDEPAAEDNAAVEDDGAVEEDMTADAETAPDDTPAAEEDVAEVETSASQDAPAEPAQDADTPAQADADETAATDDAAPADEQPADAQVATGAADADEPQDVALLTEEDMAAGERAARVCASCHQLERDRNAVGPHLVGVGGRLAGSVDGFRYSDALQTLNADGVVWNAEELDAWLAGPSDYAPGTRMNFQVDDPEDRRLISGWLAQRDQ